MPSQTNETRIILAMEAILVVGLLHDFIISLNRRFASEGITTRQSIIRHIFNLDTRGFASRLDDVEDMANFILELRRGQHIGKL